jgi:HD-GYP domain-containing protein (c-di-GMP phosphodiesterase class II)
MAAAAAEYIPIDKNFIEEGIQLIFDLYVSLSSDIEAVSCIKESGSYLTGEDKTAIDNADTLYVHESEYADYEQFQKNFLNTSSTRTVSISQQVSNLYANASNILNDLFANPETLGNYEASKEVVNDIVGVVLDNDFTIKSLLEIATHDYYTHTHSINVAIYALTLGNFLGLRQVQLSELGEAALLHDLGKSKIATDIINKNGKLTDEEFDEMKKHPNFGYTIGLKLGIKNKNILQGIRLHHEKLDGSGYPFGMQGRAIPLYARIISICDIFDALTSRRSYKDPMSTFDTLKLIKVQMGKHVDLEILQQMILMFRS